MILLDTHVVIWAVQDNPRPGVNSRAAIRQAEAEREAYIAAISIWEIAMLVAKGRLKLRKSTSEWVRSVAGMSGRQLAAPTPAIAIDAGELDHRRHGDPADRLIVATARSLGCPLLTMDNPLRELALASGSVGVIDARW